MMSRPDNGFDAESAYFDIHDAEARGDEPVELVGLAGDVWAQAEAVRSPADGPDETGRREDAQDPAELVIRQTASWLVHSMIEELPIRTQIVFEERAGLDDDPKTLAEVGEELGGLTRERIRQLEGKGLALLSENGSLQLLAYLTGRSEELPETAAQEPEASNKFILEPNFLYTDTIAAWREELWERQKRGERVYVRGRLLRQPPFPEWPHSD
jgi:hypothetical protein